MKEKKIPFIFIFEEVGDEETAIDGSNMDMFYDHSVQGIELRSEFIEIDGF